MMSLKQVFWNFIYYKYVLFQFCFIVWSFYFECNSCVLDKYAPYVENGYVYGLSWLKYYTDTISMSLFLGIYGNKTNYNVIKLN